VAGESYSKSDMRGNQEGRQEMKTDLKTMLDLASRIIEAAKVILVEDKKPRKKPKQLKKEHK
jgi:hypothetical protein